MTSYRERKIFYDIQEAYEDYFELKNSIEEESIKELKERFNLETLEELPKLKEIIYSDYDLITKGKTNKNILSFWIRVVKKEAEEEKIQNNFQADSFKNLIDDLDFFLKINENNPKNLAPLLKKYGIILIQKKAFNGMAILGGFFKCKKYKYVVVITENLSYNNFWLIILKSVSLIFLKQEFKIFYEFDLELQSKNKTLIYKNPLEKSLFEFKERQMNNPHFIIQKIRRDKYLKNKSKNIPEYLSQ